MKKIILVAAAAVMALSACGTAAAPTTTTPASAPTTPTESSTLTVVTHDSFKIPDELKAKFEKESGYKVTYVAPGDGGALVNQLILTKDSPLGDVVYGIDNSFASRALDAGVLSPYKATLPTKASELTAEKDGLLTPIDFGDVCINADKKWFEAKNLAIPKTLDDLVKPEYKNLLVVTNPASSSPGLAFLAATYGAKGDGWLDYWTQLKANGTKIAKGWSDAYYTDFTDAGKGGDRPLVLSYATSPAFTAEGDASRTVSLNDTCFRQVEYAGVIKGAKNEVGARKFIDFMLSNEVQASIPDAMYMYPVADVTLPAEWVEFAPLAENPIKVSPEDIGKNRDAWIKDWTSKILG